MRGADVVEVILVHVGIERGARANQLEVIFGARQRRKIEKFEQVDRQLAFDDVNVVQDGVDRVVGKVQRAVDNATCKVACNLRVIGYPACSCVR
jgi:hypothetical protein